jgi:16S rRNA (cytidine1402-2'-O)-methyltransferase
MIPQVVHSQTDDCPTINYHWMRKLLMGTLYIVPTPIGNLEDITLRALRVLKQVALIAAEDTRTSRVLLRHFDISTPTTSYHEHNKLTKLEKIFDALATGDVALISDAGTPGISDPGYELIQAAIAEGIRVEPLPGASALLPALVASGLPTDSFIYLGFIPRKHQAQQDFLAEFTEETRTLVIYESPKRLAETLRTIYEVLGDRQVCVAREVSKKFEEFRRGEVSKVLRFYDGNFPKGEVVLVVGGATKDATIWDEEAVRDALQNRITLGDSLSQAAKTVAAESGWKKREVYALASKD